MGLKFKEIVTKTEISFADLSGKILAVDSMNLLYQFLTTIRTPDGSVFTDKEGNVTSHLIGLFSRVSVMMEQGLQLAFVFDGKAPEIKRKTWEKRSEIKKEAALKLEEATRLGNLEEMKRQSSRTAVLNKDMIEDAQRILTALGLPIIQAPSEGEAQTAYMVKKGHAYASVSQDYDNLIFGCPRLVRNLSLEGRRKKPGVYAYQAIKPELILLSDVLHTLKLTQDQLIVLALLVGTDYNPGGIKGIGPQKGLKLLREFGTDFTALFTKASWKEAYPDLPWQEVFDTIRNIPVTDNYKLEWKPFKEKEVYSLLVEKHGFNAERVKTKLALLAQGSKQQAQQGLGSYF